VTARFPLQISNSFDFGLCHLLPFLDALSDLRYLRHSFEITESYEGANRYQAKRETIRHCFDGTQHIGVPGHDRGIPESKSADYQGEYQPDQVMAKDRALPLQLPIEVFWQLSIVPRCGLHRITS
jgi:hypothetical protein